jgi:alanine-synthesizing transaminase
LYSAVLAKLGAQPNSYLLDEQNEWQPDLQDIARKINSATRAIVVGNPNNPTGAVYSRATLERIAELARQNNLVIFADEIYDKLPIGHPGARRSCGDFQWALEIVPGPRLAGGLGSRQR